MEKIEITESGLLNVLMESVNRILNEGQYNEIKEVYYQLINKIETLIDWLQSNGYVGDGCVEGNKFVEKLKSTQSYIEDFFRHPDVGGSKKVWDNIGY